MVEKQADGERMAIRLEYQFDRLLAEKLAQAYELLVPERRRQTDHVCSQEVVNDEDGRNLLARLLRSAEGEQYDCQPGDGTNPIC